MMNLLLAAVLFLTQGSGGVFEYIVQRGDSLTSIGARFGVEVRVLAEGNGLKTSGRLQAGQKLAIDNRHIVPPSLGAAIVVNVPQRMLFHFEADNLSAGYPIAAGQPGWRTPLGEFEIVSMEEDPVWDVPPSIQEEMRKAGKPVLTRVPPSPENPLGRFWLALSLPGIGIHGTNAPTSIYKLATHGCIRLHPEDIEQLYSKVSPGARGRVTYEPVLLAGTVLAYPGLASANAPGALVKARSRALSFYSLHTTETINAVYWEEGRYIAESPAQINRLLRDHRNNEICEIAPRLLDALCELRMSLETERPFELISGYRSPSTNAKLRSEGHAVAANSLHLKGMAVDVRIPGRSLSRLRDAALALKAGGVGYYPSQFVHIDTGRVRAW